jgi:diaminohydroxyphosphoribosylaminopyrimidine deaminase/5-amino-6-(5-phosphoribosylamino)uracil reductase
MKFTTDDIEFMSYALQLAKKGIWTARPNPMVGCVIVKNNQIIAKGYHQKYGENHAEINALNEIEIAEAEDTTIYITLEPCFHIGKTPPCVDALIKAKVKKVIIAMLDVNPLVAGQSVKKLQQQGIEVEVGLLEEKAQILNRGFIKRMTFKKPFVSAKIAMSLDGKTAMASGESKWITGEEAREDVQKLRAQSDAILTGVNTILLDNPRLNVREIKCIQPLRVVLDRQNRLQNKKDLTIFSDGAKTLVLKDDLETVLKILGEREVNNVLLETGSILFSAMLKANLIDELIIYTAPMFLGASARNVLDLNIEFMKDKINLELKSISQIGQDIKITYAIINQ